MIYLVKRQCDTVGLSVGGACQLTLPPEGANGSMAQPLAGEQAAPQPSGTEQLPLSPNFHGPVFSLLLCWPRSERVNPDDKGRGKAPKTPASRLGCHEQARTARILAAGHAPRLSRPVPLYCNSHACTFSWCPSQGFSFLLEDAYKETAGCCPTRCSSTRTVSRPQNVCAERGKHCGIAS